PPPPSPPATPATHLTSPTRRSSDLQRKPNNGKMASQGVARRLDRRHRRPAARTGPSARPSGGSVVLRLLQDLQHVFQPSLRFRLDRKSIRLNSSHEWISYAVFCLIK